MTHHQPGIKPERRNGKWWIQPISVPAFIVLYDQQGHSWTILPRELHQEPLPRPTGCTQSLVPKVSYCYFSLHHLLFTLLQYLVIMAAIWIFRMFGSEDIHYCLSDSCSMKVFVLSNTNALCLCFFQESQLFVYSMMKTQTCRNVNKYHNCYLSSSRVGFK